MPRGRFNLQDFEYHSMKKRQPLSSFIPKILSYRNEVITRYKEEFDKASKFSQFSRVCNNVAIGMTKHPAIISKELFDKTQEAFTRAGKSKVRKNFDFIYP